MILLLLFGLVLWFHFYKLYAIMASYYEFNCSKYSKVGWVKRSETHQSY